MSYMCKQCGSSVIPICLTSMPPKNGYQCMGCGKQKFEKSVEESVRVIDFDEE